MTEAQSGTTELVTVFRQFHIPRRWKLRIELLLVAAIVSTIGIVYWNQPRGGGGGPEIQGFLGFDVENASIPKDEIRIGIPRRDAIPAIMEPKFVTAKDAGFLRADDLVAGLRSGSVAKAYPLRILVWHEIVNDRIGDVDVAMTYCPLCGTTMAFDRNAGGDTLTFGVSGLLYNSDVLMYDHQTESLWSQIAHKAVAGPRNGAALRWIPSDLMTWSAWQEKHPESLVLSLDTGHRRNYESTPYKNYFDSPTTMFPVSGNRNDLPEKSWVYGALVNGAAIAFSFDETQDHRIEKTIEGRDIRLEYEADAQWARAVDADTGEEIPVLRSYWFAWQAFYPETAVHTP